MPAPVKLSHLIPLLCWSVFCSVLNGTMFNVAVPDIARDFRLDPGEVSWVITGYIVIFAVGAISYGKLADHYPVRRLLTVGLLLFNLGALLSLVSDRYLLLIVGRLIQASGGAAIPALVMLCATRFAPPELRGRVLGAVSATVALAMGCGPLIGGLLAGTVHWRWLFLLSFATLPVIPLLRLVLKPEQVRPGRFDIMGAGWLTAAIALLLFGLTRQRLWPLVTAAVCGLLFLLQARRHPQPFISPALLGNRPFLRGLTATFLAMGTMFGLLFLLPLSLRQQFGLSTVDIGLVVFPGAACGAVIGLLGGRLTDRFGCRPVASVGIGLLSAGYLLLVPFGGTPLMTTLLLLICYSGFSLFQPALGKAVSLTLPTERTGIGMGLYNLVYFLSGAFGTALTGGLLEICARSGHHDAGGKVTLMIMAVTCLLALPVFRGIALLPDQEGAA